MHEFSLSWSRAQMDTRVLETGIPVKLMDFAGTTYFHGGLGWGRDGAFQKRSIRLLLLSYGVAYFWRALWL